MQSAQHLDDNVQGLSDVDPITDEGYAAHLRAYSERLRRITGHPPLPPSEGADQEDDLPHSKTQI